MERLLKPILAIINLSMVVFISIQVVARYVFNSPTTWSEEAASFSLIYLTFFGGALAVVRGQSLRITNIVEMLPERAQRWLYISMRLLAAVFLLFTVICSIPVLVQLKTQLSPAIRMPKNFIVVAVPIGALAMLFKVVSDLRQAVAGRGEPGRNA